MVSRSRRKPFAVNIDFAFFRWSTSIPSEAKDDDVADDASVERRTSVPTVGDSVALGLGRLRYPVVFRVPSTAMSPTVFIVFGISGQNG
jgi:hypothetical protein